MVCGLGLSRQPTQTHGMKPTFAHAYILSFIMESFKYLADVKKIDLGFGSLYPKLASETSPSPQTPKNTCDTSQLIGFEASSSP